MSRGKIVITPRPFNTKGMYFIDLLESRGYEVDYNSLNRRFLHEELLDKIEDADAIITGNDLLNEEILKESKQLKVISKYGVGLDNIDVKYANKMGIKVCKALGANSRSVAEMTILMMLSASRDFVNISNRAKNGNEERVIGQELYGKTLGILGLGAIGKKVAKIALSFEMKVIAYDPYVMQSDSELIELVSQNRLIQESDYISLHIPLTENTAGIINKSVFDRMKESAILINSARAGLVENKALYQALTEGKIRYVIEDVELKERDKAIIDLPNYSITPHAASFTVESDNNTMKIAVDNVLKVLEGGSI